MHPQSIHHSIRVEYKKPERSKDEEKDYSTVYKDVNKSNSTTHFKESPHSIKLQSKHKIGPKNI
jgi:hypothetical protein